MDWSKWSEVESVPGKVSGALVVKGTRVQADAVVENASYGFSAQEIASEIFPTLPIDRVERVIRFARTHESHPA